MKIVVVGGTGLIGSKVIALLSEAGHDASAAAPSTGVDALTGEGLDAALARAQVVVDVSNSPSFEDRAVLDFFRTSTANLLAAEARAGVGSHVALSVVGTERLTDSGYMRAKVAQEQLIRGSGRPYSLVHATQFFEFVRGIADSSTVDGEVRLAAVHIQPMAADDVAAGLAAVVLAGALNGTVELAGPERFLLPDLVRTALGASGDARPVVEDADARYFGARLELDELVPGEGARLGSIRFADWLAAATAR